LSNAITTAAQVVTPTTLAAQGPGGAASIVLERSEPVSVLDLLNGNQLVLPQH